MEKTPMLGLEQITWHLSILNPIFLEYEDPLCLEEAPATDCHAFINSHQDRRGYAVVTMNH